MFIPYHSINPTQRPFPTVTTWWPQKNQAATEQNENHSAYTQLLRSELLGIREEKNGEPLDAATPRWRNTEGPRKVLGFTGEIHLWISFMVDD